MKPNDQALCRQHSPNTSIAENVRPWHDHMRVSLRLLIQGKGRSTLHPIHASIYHQITRVHSTAPPKQKMSAYRMQSPIITRKDHITVSSFMKSNQLGGPMEIPSRPLPLYANTHAQPWPWPARFPSLQAAACCFGRCMPAAVPDTAVMCTTAAWHCCDGWFENCMDD